MEATDLSRRMRATFEAVLPDDDTVVRRVTDGRAERTLALRSSPVRSHARAPTRHRPWQARLTLGFACATILGLVLLLWTQRTPDPVPSIGPSLARDLASQGKSTSAEQARPAGELENGSRQAAPADDASRAKPSTASEQIKKAALESERAPEVPAGESTDARWAHVTAAMRRQDWKAAEVALAPLIQSADPETRDGARLVRVRLQLRAASEAVRDPKWLRELSDLATSGATSSIRASARRLLDTPQDGVAEDEGSTKDDRLLDDSTKQLQPMREPSLGGN